MSQEVKAPDVSKYWEAQPPAETKDYIFQQTMIRIKDPFASLDFYTNVLGFKLVYVGDFPQWKFSVYFLAPTALEIPSDPALRFAFCMKIPGTIELCYNYGTESQEGPVYNTGNGDSTGTQDGQKVKGGFGHIGITVPDVYEACERFHKLGCTFHKSPNGGGMKGLAFIKDPDGYLVEILPQGDFVTKPVDCLGVRVDGSAGYKDNSKA